MALSLGSAATIPHSRPTLGAAALEALAEVVHSGRIAQGPKVAAFEEGLARLLGVQGAVATSSGTAALHLALLGLQVGEGDEVLVPSYACAALLHAVRAARAVPRPVDSDPVSFNMDPEAAKRARSAKTKALIVVHSFGLPADLYDLKALGVPLVEAAAQALGGVYRGRPVGSVGDVAVLSFYATKPITTGEGGMLLSSDARILAAGRDLREYDGKDDDRPRFNYKMTDLQAALGLAQLAQLPGFLRRRGAIASRYSGALGARSVDLPLSPEDRVPTWYRYVVRGPLPAEQHVSRLQALGVDARQPVFRPLHRLLGLAGFPGADEAWRRAVSLPVYPALAEQEVDRITAAALETFR